MHHHELGACGSISFHFIDEAYHLAELGRALLVANEVLLELRALDQRKDNGVFLRSASQLLWLILSLCVMQSLKSASSRG